MLVRRHRWIMFALGNIEPYMRQTGTVLRQLTSFPWVRHTILEGDTANRGGRNSFESLSLPFAGMIVQNYNEPEGDHGFSDATQIVA
jgi:hypothetical protein